MTQNQRIGSAAASALPFRGATPYAAARSGVDLASRVLRATRVLNAEFLERASLVALAIWALVASGDLAGAILHERDGAWLGVATAGVMLLAALVSSIAGFAFSPLAGTALAYLGMEPVHAVQAMVVCSIANQLYAVWKIREAVRWSSVWPMLLAGALTVPFGVWLLVHIDGSVYAMGLGVFMTSYGCYVLIRRGTTVVRGSTWLDALAGALGGLAGGLAGFPGSFVTIWCSMRGWDKLRQRAVYQPYILGMQIVTIACLRWHAPIHANVLHDLRLVPFALLGAVGGLALFQRMSNKQFQLALSVLLVVSGIGVLGRTL